MPARAGRRTPWPPVRASTRSATRRSPRCRSGGAGSCVPGASPRAGRGRGPGGDHLVTRVGAIDCGTNSIRLLVADVDRRRRRSLTDVVRRMEIVRLGQGVDRTGRHRAGGAGAHPGAWPASTPRSASSRGRAGPVRRDVGVPRRRQPRRVRRRRARRRSRRTASRPRWSPAHEEAALSFLGATGGLRRTASHGPVPRGRHRRRVDRVRPRHRRDVGAGPVGRHRLRPDDRAAPARRPADRCGGRGRDRRRRRGASTRPPRRWTAGVADPGRAGRHRSPRSPRTRCGLTAYDPAASTWRRCRCDRGRRGLHRRCWA